MAKELLSKWSGIFITVIAVSAISIICDLAYALSYPTQDPAVIPKYKDPMTIPAVMPKTSVMTDKDGQQIGYYEIAIRQFSQQVLPKGMPLTTVWGYGSVQNPQGFSYPGYTFETINNRSIRVKWINELLDQNGNYLPHPLPVDQTVNWANPPGGISGRDSRGISQDLYKGPVPLVTHLHGAHSLEESDGYPEEWTLAAAENIPAGYAKTGTYYDIYKASSPLGNLWTPGSAVFYYRNDQRATALWYHDHALGMTRTNIYMGLAGFYIIRGGVDDEVKTLSGKPAVLPNPAPVANANPLDRFYEIPILIQDRSFNSDGSLFYPDSRVLFDGFTGPYSPETDIAPIWNPEFFGNVIVVNGKTWPYLEVEQRRYRFRILNGSGSRFLILKFENDLPFWVLGADGGFLPQPVLLTQLLMARGERLDVIVDFTNVPVGTNIILQNIGPDGPFEGGIPGVDFVPANAATTGQVIEMRVVKINGIDTSTPPSQLLLPKRIQIGKQTTVRHLSLNEHDSTIMTDVGPIGSFLGLTDLSGLLPVGISKIWADSITENPDLGETEIWELYNFTANSHPIHLNQVQFEIIGREVFDPLKGTPGTIRDPEPWEAGTKDTVIAYPGQITRVKAYFDIPGIFVWSGSKLEDEDNEMMRPYRVGPETIIIDNVKDAYYIIKAGKWGASTSVKSFWGEDYCHDQNTHKGEKFVKFTPDLPTAGRYKVAIWYTAAANRASNVPVDIVSSHENYTIIINQRENGSKWVELGTYLFDEGAKGSVTIRNTATDGYVIADAVRFVPVPETILDDSANALSVTKAGKWGTSTSAKGFWGEDYCHDQNTHKGLKYVRFITNLPAAGWYKVAIWYTAAANRASNVPVDIVSSYGTYTVIVDQKVNGSKWVELGTYMFDAGTKGSVTIRNTDTDGYTIADAVRFTQ